MRLRPWQPFRSGLLSSTALCSGVVEPGLRMAVLGPQPLDELGRGRSIRGELLARPLAQRPGKRVDLADRGWRLVAHGDIEAAAAHGRVPTS